MIRVALTLAALLFACALATAQHRFDVTIDCDGGTATIELPDVMAEELIVVVRPTFDTWYHLERMLPTPATADSYDVLCGNVVRFYGSQGTYDAPSWWYGSSSRDLMGFDGALDFGGTSGYSQHYGGTWWPYAIRACPGETIEIAAEQHWRWDYDDSWGSGHGAAWAMQRVVDPGTVRLQGTVWPSRQ